MDALAALALLGPRMLPAPIVAMPLLALLAAAAFPLLIVPAAILVARLLLPPFLPLLPLRGGRLWSCRRLGGLAVLRRSLPATAAAAAAAAAAMPPLVRRLGLLLRLLLLLLLLRALRLLLRRRRRLPGLLPRLLARLGRRRHGPVDDSFQSGSRRLLVFLFVR
ncbi:MAG: hypothetical protein KGK30_10025, partial [Elusimicrobia bacterium]|nr:hypothetical protein [Elusimicrobiota bacterium]